MTDITKIDIFIAMNVAIIGRPNVGKSALFNRLVGRKIAIVHDQPGITRDRISAICTRGERPFTVWDTGGILGAGETELTAQVRRAVERSARRKRSSLVRRRCPRSVLRRSTKSSRGLLRKSRKPVVLVVNKIDNDKHEPLAAEFDSLGFEHSVSISAEHNRGIAELLEQIEQTPARNVEIRIRESDESPDANSRYAIAIVGRPNVGKSSLINAIVQERARHRERTAGNDA